MRYSNTAITELSAKYRSVLKKCALLNAAILLTTVVVLPAGATDIPDYGAAINNPLGGEESVSAGSELSGYKAYKKGGAIYNEGTLTIGDGVVFSENETTWDGAAGSGPDDKNSNGGAIWNSGSITMGDNITFLNNHASNLTTSGNGHGSDIYNYGGSVQIGDNLSILRDQNFHPVPYKHDCAIFISGGSLTIGNNAALSNISEGIVMSGNATLAIGDGLRMINIDNGIDNWGTQDIVIGANATFDGSHLRFLANDDNGSVDWGKVTKITIGNNAVFKNAMGSTFGTIYNGPNDTIKFLGSSEFTNNKTFSNNAGVFQNFNGNLSFGGDAVFKGNMANGVAGALRNRNSNSSSIFDGTATFTGNAATGDAGAIINEGTLVFNKAATFTSNVAGGLADFVEDKNGTIYDDETDKYYSWTIDGVNTASNKNGGAIHNTKTITFNDETSFTDNKASGLGGAIYNTSVISFEKVSFSGNKAGAEQTLNDIYNTGTLNFNSDSTLDGGITGNGSTVFANGSSLTVNAGTTTIENAITNNGASLAMIFANGFSDDTYQLVTGSLDQEFDIQQNALYSILATDTNGTYTITKKSTDEVVENLTKNGEATAQEAATISAIADATVDHPVLNKITEAVQTGDVKTAAKAAQDLAPTTSQAALGISKDVQSLLTSTAAARMASLAGRSGGDVFKGGSMWVQGLFNHTKQDSTSRNEGFKANSKGIAFGIDGKLNDAVTVGLGYGYTRTDADAGNRDIDVDGNNVFAYAEYSPDAWYVNGVLNFGYGRYTEKKSPLGHTMKSKYDVYTYGVNVMTGYALDSGLTPEGGLRYLLVDQKSYDDGVEKIKTSNNDILTAVLGAKYGYKVKAKDWMFTPNVRLAATYDLMSDESKAVSSITGGSSYQINGERLHRLGFEAGVGVTSTWNNWDFTLSYDGGFRQDYQSHTGTLKAKYHF